MVLLMVILLSVGSYEVGKYGEKASIVTEKKVCFDQPYYDRKAGCYKVIPPASTDISEL